MRLTASAAVAVVVLLSACGDAREVDEGGGGGMHAIPFVAQHTAAARANIASCTACHGTDFGGGTAAQTSCNDCHAAAAPGAAFADDWRDNCTFCHGSGRDPSWAGDLAAVAPPESADGAGAQDSTNPKVGAHQAHLTAGTFSNPLTCDSCHTVPPLTFAGGSLAHVDGINDPQFSTTAVQGVASPGYTRASGTCAVYCHGSTAALGNNTSPAWTSGAIQCGDCHAVTAPAPTSGAHTLHLGIGVQCDRCHPGYSETIVNPATHVNGTFEAVIQANPAAGRPTKDATHSSWPLTGTGIVDCDGCHI